MTMIPFDGNISQAMKWMQNNAPKIQALVQQKKDWYNQFHDVFWTNWQRDVFDLRTANAFGIRVWCIILGVPSGELGLGAIIEGWAYGPARQNFIYSGIDPNLPDPNLKGGNFNGGAEVTILEEIRKILKLRYVAMTSNGNVKYINYMLRFIFNNDQPWDIAGGKYFWLVDCTASPTVGNVPGPFRLEFRIGPSMGLSSQFIRFLNNPDNGVLPTMAGSLSIAIQE